MRARVFFVALFALSLGLTTLLLRSLLGWPDASGLRAKLAYYEADPEGFDVVFVGSSNVLCSIIPPIFEEELRKRGHEVRAYNLGVPGMLSFETDYLAKRVLEHRPERLRWMFLELTEWRPDPRMSDPTERTVHWHTPERTAALIETALAYDSYGPMDVAAFARDHVELCMWRLGNFGRLQQRVLLSASQRDPDRWTELMRPAVEGGYLALEELGHEGAEEGRRRFLGDLPRYQRTLQELRRESSPSGPPPEYLLGPARRQLALFDESGVTPIHLLLATSHPTPELLQLGGPEGPLPELWSYNDPDRYPDLFKLQARYDNRHLNREGAEWLTRLLAQRFAERLDQAHGG